MYKCERCGGVFAKFKTPGQCPLCGVWASVRCSGCGHTAHANVFIANGDQCPKCGARVPVPGKKDEACFIATAAFGTIYCDEVNVLRAFRDQILTHYKPGQWFVRIYYRAGPLLARHVAKHRIVRRLVVMFLLPVVAASKRIVSRIGK